ncbi:hypothetical protein ACRARH_27785 [Phytobacter ursingii]
MAKQNRDEFTPKTIRTLQERAGCRCSMPGCGVVTIGPSEVSPEKSINLGIASHICAAAPDGPRYDPNMTSEARKHIENGIWLCATHSILIDRDVVSYPVEELHRMKKLHEEAIKLENRSGQGFLQHADFIAMGPDIVGLGELLGTSGNKWSIRINHFVAGDISQLISFIEDYENKSPLDRYVIINALGDGRQLSASPSWCRNGTSIELTCTVKNRFPRKNVHALGNVLDINSANDIYLNKGDFAVVGGVEALPQKIRTALSLIQGESPFYPKAGSRLKEYFDEFEDSPWLTRWMKLEVIRLSCIPFFDTIINIELTPLECITKVIDVIPTFKNTKGNWREFKFKLEVEGIGVWEKILSICVPFGDMPTKPKGWDTLRF